MSNFNFKNLIKKYSKSPTCQIRKNDGYYDYSQGGIYIEGTIEKIEVQAAIVPLSKQELEYGEGGTYTTNDRKMYCYIDLKEGTVIEYKELKYTIQEKLDYSDFDKDLYIYIVKRSGV